MTEHRVIVEDQEATAQAERDALASMIGGVDERLERLERASTTPTPCRLDHQVLARALHDLEPKLEAAVERALLAHARRLGSDDDEHLPPMARRAANVVSDHWWGRFSKRFTLAVLGAGLAVLLAVGTYLAAKLGVLK